MRFVEFNLRASIYRNIVLSIEVKMILFSNSFLLLSQPMAKYTKKCIVHLLRYLFSTFGGQLFRFGYKKCRIITQKTWRFMTTFLLSCERTALWSILGQKPKDYLQFTGTRDRTQRAPGWSRAQRLQRGSQGPGLRRERRKPRNLRLFREQFGNLWSVSQRLPLI